jgi:probable rRNA maturation factor
VTIDVFGADEQADCEVALTSLVALSRSVLEAEGVRNGAEVSLLFVDEPTIAELNERFLGHSGPTDVLSFPLEDEPLASGRQPDSGGTGPGEPLDEEPPDLLGDVVVCPKVAASNAVRDGVGYDDELALLVVHGTLHLLGWDHEEDAAAQAMERREHELLLAHFSPTWAGR